MLLVALKHFGKSLTKMPLSRLALCHDSHIPKHMQNLQCHQTLLFHSTHKILKIFFFYFTVFYSSFFIFVLYNILTAWQSLNLHPNITILDTAFFFVFQEM